MMAIINWDFFGTEEELMKLDKAYERMAEKTKGVEFLGRYTPTTLKWHFSYFFKAEDQQAWLRARPNFNYARDKTKMPHGVVWQFV